MEKGIYLEVARIPVVTALPNPTASHGKMHSYLVYRDGKGNERVIRGGPYSWWDAASGGDIKVEIDVPLEHSRDKYAPDEVRGSRPSRKLDLGGRLEEEVWADMMKEAKRIHEGQMDYDFVPVYQNSNSATRAVLKADRIEASKALPPAITKYGLPGFDNDLSAPYDRIDEMSGMGGRDGRSSPGDGAQKGNSSGRKAGISGLPPSRQEGIKEAGLPVGDLWRRIRAPGAPHEEAMAKPVATWTEDDARAVMAARIGKPVSEAERQAMAAREREFFRRLYGDGPAPYDATGRLMSAASLRPAKSADAERSLARLLGLR